jgi:hypothetical protein
VRTATPSRSKYIEIQSEQFRCFLISNMLGEYVSPRSESLPDHEVSERVRFQGRRHERHRLSNTGLCVLLVQ